MGSGGKEIRAVCSAVDEFLSAVAAFQRDVPRFAFPPQRVSEIRGIESQVSRVLLQVKQLVQGSQALDPDTYRYVLRGEFDWNPEDSAYFHDDIAILAPGTEELYRRHSQKMFNCGLALIAAVQTYYDNYYDKLM